MLGDLSRFQPTRRGPPGGLSLTVLSLVHDAHASAAELVDDAVVRDDLADHWAQILGSQARQVNGSRGVGRSWRGLGRMVGAKSPLHSLTPGEGVLSVIACLRQLRLQERSHGPHQVERIQKLG